MEVMQNKMIYYVIPIYLLLNIIVFWCLNRWITRAIPFIAKHKSLSVLLGLAYLVLMIIPILGVILEDSDFRFFCISFGNHFMGAVAFFGIAILLIPCLLRLFLYLLKREESRETRKQIYSGKKAAWAILLLSAAFSFSMNYYGMENAENITVKKYSVKINKSAGGVKSLKIMLLGDLHMSVNSNPEMYERMVKMVNREKPDIIFTVGDFFTSTYEGLDHPEKYIAALQKMKAPMGNYAVYGNHDVNEPLLIGFPLVNDEDAIRSQEMVHFLRESGFTMLNDQVISIAGSSIQLAGRLDGERSGDGKSQRKKASVLLKDIDRKKPLIVLEHEPWEFEDLQKAGADFILSGHTHNGQIFPGNIIVNFFNENGYGYKRVDGLQTLVTGGVGYYGPPLRIGTHSEITVIDLNFN